MGLREAKKYIDALHKKQGNPYLWPDFLTGLPDRAAVLKKLYSIYPRLGNYSVAYIKIANIHPYILKYGYDRHAETIQWAAAILKTLSSEIKGSFVGTVGTHDFVFISKTNSIDDILKKANSLFKRKTLSFYSKDDKKRGYVLSFKRADGKNVKIGFMKFVTVLLKRPANIEKMQLIPTLSQLCTKIEDEGQDRTEL